MAFSNNSLTNFMPNKDEFLVYFENNLKKGLKNKALPDNILDILRELDNHFLEYAGIPKTGLKPHIFESLYENRLYDRPYELGEVRPSHLQYIDIAKTLALQDLDDLKRLYTEIENNAEYYELSTLTKGILSHLESGKDPDLLYYSPDAVPPSRVNELIEDMKRLKNASMSKIVKDVMKKVLHDSREADEMLIFNSLPSFLKKITSKDIPLASTGGNKFIGDRYKECFNAGSRLKNNVVMVDDDFIAFLNKKYKDRTGVALNAKDLESFVIALRKNPTSVTGFLREDILAEYGNKTFVTKDCIERFSQSYTLQNIGLSFSDLNGILECGLGGSFLRFLKEEPDLTGVWDLKYGARDMFIGDDSPKLPPKVEAIRPDEIVRNYNNALLVEALGEENVPLILPNLTDFNKGLVDISLFGKEIQNFNLDKFLDNFDINAFAAGNAAYGAGKMKEFIDYFVKETGIKGEELVSMVSNPKLNPNPMEKMVIHAASFIKAKQEEFKLSTLLNGKPDVSDSLTETKGEDKEKRAKYSQELTRINQELKDNYNGFAITLSVLKENYTDVAYELKNVLTGGYSLGSAQPHANYLSNVTAGLELMGATRAYAEAISEDTFRTSVQYSDRISQEIDEVNADFVQDGYGEVINYANVQQANEARVYNNIRDLMGSLDATNVLSKREQNPAFDGAINKELPKLEIIARELSYLHSNDDKFNAQLLVKVYNELVERDSKGVPISPYEVSPSGKITSRLKTRDSFIDKNKPLTNGGYAIDLENEALRKIEGTFLSRMATLNVLSNEIKEDYPEIIKRIENTYVDTKDFVPDYMIKELNLPERLSAQTISELLVQRQQLMFETIGRKTMIEDELTGATLAKNRILERTEFLEKSQIAKNEAFDFLTKNEKVLRRNLDLGDDLFLNIEIPNGMFFSKEELTEIFMQSIKENTVFDVKTEAEQISDFTSSRLKKLGFDRAGNFVEARSSEEWANLELMFYSPVIAPAIAKGVLEFEDVVYKESEDSGSGEQGGKESKGKKESNGITDETVAIEAQARLENNPDRDDPVVIERVKNEIKRDFEEAIALERLREQIRKEVEKSNSEEVKEKSDEYKQEAITQADRTFNDILSGIANKYNITYKDVIDNIGGVIVDTSDLDEGTISQIQNLTKELGVFDHRVETGEQIILTPVFLANEYYKTLLINDIANEFDQGLLKDAINEARLREEEQAIKDGAPLAPRPSIIDKGYEERLQDNISRVFNREERKNMEGRFNDFYHDRSTNENYASFVAENNAKIVRSEEILSQMDDFFDRDKEITQCLKNLSATKEAKSCAQIYSDLEDLCPMADFSRLDLEEVKEFMESAKEAVAPQTAPDGTVLNDPLQRIADLSSSKVLDATVKSIHYNEDVLRCKSLKELGRRINGEYDGAVENTLYRLKDWFYDTFKGNANTELRRELARRMVKEYADFSGIHDPAGPHYKGMKSVKDLLSPTAWFTTIFDTIKALYTIGVMIKYTHKMYIPTDERLRVQGSIGDLFTPSPLSEKYIKELGKIADKGLELGVLNLDDIPSSTKDPYFKEIRNMNKNVFVRSFEDKDGVDAHRDKSAYTKENIMLNIEQNIKKIEERITQVTDNINMDEETKNKVLTAYEKTRLVQASFYLALSQKSFDKGLTTLDDPYMLPIIGVSNLEKLERDIFKKFEERLIDVKNEFEVEHALSKLNAPEIIKSKEIAISNKDENFERMSTLTNDIIEKFGLSELETDPRTINEIKDLIKRDLGEGTKAITAEGKIDFIELGKMVDQQLLSVNTVAQAAKDNVLNAATPAKNAELEILAKDPELAIKINEKKFNQIEEYRLVNNMINRNILDFVAKEAVALGAVGQDLATFAKSAGISDKGALYDTIRRKVQEKDREKMITDTQLASSAKKKREDDLAAGFRPI